MPGVLDRSDGLGLTGEHARGPLRLQPPDGYAGGGIISTSGDLAQWGKTLWEGSAFSAARLADMLDGKPAEKGTTYGLATEILQTGAGPAYTHDGWIFGYLSVVIYIPKDKLAAALQINSDPMKQFKIQPDHCLSEILTTVVHELGTTK